MRTSVVLLAISLFAPGGLKAAQTSFPRVDSDLTEYDKAVAKMQADFEKLPADPHDKEWVKKKLRHMFDVDQFMRMNDIPVKNKYSQAEKKYFLDRFRGQLAPRFNSVDSANMRDLKDLLKLYGWFKISEFGKEADQDAWLLVQHSDEDVAFQKDVLKKLEALYLRKETIPRNFAYLFDRVAANEHRPQRYGTQGRCAGPGKWEPKTLEDPEHLDQRRKAVGLSSLEEYKKGFINNCR